MEATILLNLKCDKTSSKIGIFMKNKPLQKSIVKIIKNYQKSFIAKVYPKTKGQSDVLLG